jgi:hypothetical protein
MAIVGGGCGGPKNFQIYERRKGNDLRDGARIWTESYARDYSNADTMYLIRQGRWVEIEITCSYPSATSLNSVSLDDFLPLLMQYLRRNRRPTINARRTDAMWGENQLEVSAEFPASMRLGCAYAKLIDVLKKKHAATLADVMGHCRERELARLKEIQRKRARGSRKRPEVFVCHDSRDKKEIANEVAERLMRLGCRVWYDDFSLAVGDSLRESIECGLKKAEKCILILSPRFLSNGGWTKAEFNSIFSIEVGQRQNIILPVWAGVTRSQVLAYSPMLADRVGVNWSLGSKEVVRRLLSSIRE